MLCLETIVGPRYLKKFISNGVIADDQGAGIIWDKINLDARVVGQSVWTPRVMS
jgi:hypothetical protein